MKIIAEYDPAIGTITDVLGGIWSIGINVQFEEYKEIPKIVTGLTVEDLVKLKTNGVI